jgi:putative membrane protein
MSQDSRDTNAVDAPLDPSLISNHYSWIRTRLSIERTFLSWVRTATSLIGFGFTVFQFLDKLGRADVRPTAPRNFGLAFIGAGILAMLIGWWQHHSEMKYLSKNEFSDIGWRSGLPVFHGPNYLALVVAAIGVVAFVWVLIGY